MRSYFPIIVVLNILPPNNGDRKKNIHHGHEKNTPTRFKVT